MRGVTVPMFEVSVSYVQLKSSKGSAETVWLQREMQQSKWRLLTSTGHAKQYAVGHSPRVVCFHCGGKPVTAQPTLRLPAKLSDWKEETSEDGRVPTQEPAP